jgi:hypothetical protein
MRMKFGRAAYEIARAIGLPGRYRDRKRVAG